MSKFSDIFREEAARLDSIRDAGLKTPDDISRVDDILYGEDPQWQKLDVYRPKASAGETLPVIINVHGGSWVYGDKETYQYYAMQLAQHGFAVVNFTYRLAPMHKFPAPLEDMNLVAGWVLSNAEKYGLDVQNIFAVGDSAGAQILSSYAAIATNPDYAKSFYFSVPEGFALKALGLNCGLYQIAFDDPESIEIKPMADYLPGKDIKKEQRQISVVNHVTSAFPPTFLMTSLGDFLRKQAPIFNARLDECGVQHVYRLYGTREKPLEHVFHCNVRLREGILCNDEECRFFKSFL